ncbi:MAG: ankyrin repeat domain-containing protein [Alphaproteobacteria bacterium]|nr:ankyrin repeat domain-containing protein [Alphaproteobacteria bacterium]
MKDNKSIITFFSLLVMGSLYAGDGHLAPNNHQLTDSSMLTPQELFLTQIDFAIIYKQYDELDSIVQSAGSLINEPSNGQKQTPLHIAIWKKDIMVLLTLLKYGANFEAKDSFGMTPLHYAVLLGRMSILERLIQCGANIEAGNSSGMTPLYTAMNTKNEAIIELLIKNGADVTKKNPNNGTSLVTTARNQELSDQMQKLLIEKVVETVQKSRGLTDGSVK